jgi:hypothetical protein
MNLNVLWRRLIKRPLVSVLMLILLILAGLAGYAGWALAGGQAESRSVVVVVPPWSVEDENFPNPMLNLTERATALASALVVAIQRSDVEASVVEAGATSYQASNIGSDVRDPTRSAIIFLTVTGPNEEAAHAGAERIIDGSRAVLKQMQEEAGTGNAPRMATLQVISQPQETTTFALRQIRSAAALAAAVLIGGILILWAVDSIIDRRSRSRERGIQPTLEDLVVDRREGSHFDELNANSESVGPTPQNPSENALLD